MKHGDFVQCSEPNCVRKDGHKMPHEDRDLNRWPIGFKAALFTTDGEVHTVDFSAEDAEVLSHVYGSSFDVPCSGPGNTVEVLAKPMLYDDQGKATSLDEVMGIKQDVGPAVKGWVDTTRQSWDCGPLTEEVAEFTFSTESGFPTGAYGVTDAVIVDPSGEVDPTYLTFDPPLNRKESLGRRSKPDLTHVRRPFKVYTARGSEYGVDKYVRSNAFVDCKKEDTRAAFELFREYLRAVESHISFVTDAMERHQAGDPDLLDADGMRTAAGVVDSEPGLNFPASELPHLAHACAALNMATTQAVWSGLLPDDPGTPWKDDDNETR